MLTPNNKNNERRCFQMTINKSGINGFIILINYYD